MYFTGVSVGARESFKYSIDAKAAEFVVIEILAVPEGTATCTSE
jgi:hypothetical protein